MVIKILDTTTVSITTEEFDVRKKFHKDSEEVRFSGIWDNFIRWFTAETIKIEEPIGERIVCYGELTRESTDRDIIFELGGEAKAETTLADLHFLLKGQGNGEEGVLATNSTKNTFYVRDIRHILRSVNVYYCQGVGWYVDACSVESPCRRLAGRRIFFPLRLF